MIDSAALSPVVLDDGRVLAVRLRASRRASRIAIRLRSWGDIELVVPDGARKADALAFLALRMPWIRARARTLPVTVPLLPGAEVPVLGVTHTLTEAGRGEKIFAIGNGLIKIGGAPAHFPRRARDGLRRHALELLSRKTVATATILGRPVARIGIGDMRTRWGSCSSAGRIRYSWRLVLAPEAVMDYVVVHEVSHLVHMNHGPRFWQIVERLRPDYRTARSWLKQQGPGLLRYG